MAPKSLMQVVDSLPHMDNSESIFFARELERIRPKAYEKKYADLKAMMFIPIDRSLDPGAELDTYVMYDQFGMAKIVSDYANDFPRADVKGQQFTTWIKSLGASYGYNHQEVRSARFTGKPLEQMRANSARRAIDEGHDYLLCF